MMISQMPIIVLLSNPLLSTLFGFEVKSHFKNIAISIKFTSLTKRSHREKGNKIALLAILKSIIATSITISHNFQQRREKRTVDHLVLGFP